MPEFQPNHYPAIQDFLQWKDAAKTRRNGRGGPESDTILHYIPSSELEQYLTTEKIKTLLEELFTGWDKPLPDPARVRQYYLRPFAILLSAGFGHMIYYVVDYQNLRDQNLPFFDKPKNFPKTTKVDLFDAFHKEQWQFCAVRLEYDMTNHLGDNEILPILTKEQIRGGGSAIAYKITVDEDYNSLVPTRRSKAVDSQSIIKSHCNS